MFIIETGLLLNISCISLLSVHMKYTPTPKLIVWIPALSGLGFNSMQNNSRNQKNKKNTIKEHLLNFRCVSCCVQGVGS